MTANICYESKSPALSKSWKSIKNIVHKERISKKFIKTITKNQSIDTIVMKRIIIRFRFDLNLRQNIIVDRENLCLCICVCV